MRETWTHDTDSVRLLLWIAVVIDNMFILYLRTVSVYIVSKSMQNYEINSILMSLFMKHQSNNLSTSGKFGGYWQNGFKNLVEVRFPLFIHFCHLKS